MEGEGLKLDESQITGGKEAKLSVINLFQYAPPTEDVKVSEGVA